MRDITKLMIVKYKLLELKYDFMGYEFDKEKELSFHHLIIPHRLCKVREIENDGYIEANGSILKQSSSHNYLHVIERYDRDMFDAITCQMVDENLKGYIDLDNIKRIDDILKCFEREYSGARTKHGSPLIKEEYTRRRIRR
jgi:hypothetical protein